MTDPVLDTHRRLILIKKRAFKYIAKTDGASFTYLFRLIETIKYWIKHPDILPDDEWKNVFIRRLQRTLIGAERLSQYAPAFDSNKNITIDENSEEYQLHCMLLHSLWESYQDECQRILENRSSKGDARIWATFERVKTFETELEQRKKQFECIHGPRKSLRELFNEHHVFVHKYLQKCVSLHSHFLVRDLEEGDEGEICEENEHIRNQPTFVQSDFDKIEIPLRLSSNRMEQLYILSSRKQRFEEVRHTRFIPSIKEEIIKKHSNEKIETIFSLLRNHRWSVILGDPGSGKTTLLRWLTLQFASSLLQQEPFSTIDTIVDKGDLFMSTKRVPIFICITELIPFLDAHPTSLVMDYIKHSNSFRTNYGEDSDARILQEFIHHGHALILFDGLDEVVDYQQRQRIVTLIERFLDEIVQSPAYISVNDEKAIVKQWGGFISELPQIAGGNQAIITSRLIGYQLFPLMGQQLTHFLLCLLNGEEFQLFVDHWVHDVHRSITERTDVIVLNKQHIELIGKGKEKRIKELLNNAGEHVWSHPMLLSLILPFLYNRIESVDLTSRVSLYEVTVRASLYAKAISEQSMISSEKLEWILRDMAVYLHEHCPSGIIDTFDLTKLAFISLKTFYKQKNIVSVEISLLRKQVSEFVKCLISNIGFVAALGLDAYGFAHRTFQEYFTAMGLVKPSLDDTPISASTLIDRLLAFIMKSQFYEPIVLAIEWISWKWREDEFNAFCRELIDKHMGSLPLGAMLFVDILGDLACSPSQEFLSQFFDRLTGLSLDENSLEYLRRGLSKTTIASKFLHKLWQRGSHSELFFRIFLRPFKKWKTGCGEEWELPSWLSKDTFLNLVSSDHGDERIEAIADLALRKFHITNDLWSTNNLSTFLLSRNITSFNIHPILLSVIIAICGGLNVNREKERNMKKKKMKRNIVKFIPDQMHRITPLSDLFIEYFTNYSDDISGRGIPNLINKCEEIIQTASPSDISRKVVDAFVALICLRGMQQPHYYQSFNKYIALSRALKRLKLVLYHMRQHYTQKNIFSVNKVRILMAELLAFTENLESVVLGITTAFTRLTLTNIHNATNIPLPASFTSEKHFVERLASHSSRFLRLIGNLSFEEGENYISLWEKGTHPYQLFHHYHLFPVAFLSSRLQRLFGRLLLTDRLDRRLETNEVEKLPFVVLLAEILHSLTNILRRFRGRYNTAPRPLLLLLTLEDDSHSYGMRSYLVSLIHDIKTKEQLPEFIENFIQSHIFDQENVLTEEERLGIALSLVGNCTDQRKIDLQLFSSSIGLARMCELTNKQTELFEEAETGAHAIGDPVLRIFCFHHLCQVVCRWIDTCHYYRIQNKLMNEIDRLPQNTPMLISALILATCTDKKKHFHASLQKLFNSILMHLQSSPKNEIDSLDQEIVCHALCNIFDGRIEMSSRIPIRSYLSLNPQMFSPVFSNYFQTEQAFSSSNKVLLCQMYLAELTIDAQILQIFTESSSESTVASTTMQQQLKRLWMPVNNGHLFVFPHRGVLLINTFLQFESSEIITIPYKSLGIWCDGFEDSDRPEIENWLTYNDDERRHQFAVFAAFLLIRSRKKVSAAVLVKIEKILRKAIFSEIDSIRRGARACFMFNRQQQISCIGWSKIMWRLLKKLCIGSLDDCFLRHRVNFVEDLCLLLELEWERLVSSSNDEYPHLPFLLMVESCSNQVCSYIESLLIVLNDASLINDPQHDAYYEALLLHLVKKFEDDQWSNSLFKLLTSLIYSSRLPRTQQAAAYCLGSREYGRDFLVGSLCTHCSLSEEMRKPDSRKSKALSDQVLIAYLRALTKCRIDESMELSKHPQLENCLWNIWHSSESDNVSQHAQACFLSHTLVKTETFEDLLLILDVEIDTLYTLFMMNTSYLIRWDERSDWILKAGELVGLHLVELIKMFVNDLYTMLCDDPTIKNFRSIQPNFLYVARELMNNDEFRTAIQESRFGEKEFRNALYEHSKRCAADERLICIRLYLIFKVLTEDLIDMLFAACLDDYTCLQRYAFLPIEGVQNREVIESIFSYLKSKSMIQRYVAAQQLVEFVLSDILSAAEVCQLLADVLKDPTSKQIVYIREDEEGKPFDVCIRSLLLRTTCLKRLETQQSSSVFTLDEVEADFCDCLRTPLYASCSL